MVLALCARSYQALSLTAGSSVLASLKHLLLHFSIMECKHLNHLSLKNIYIYLDVIHPALYQFSYRSTHGIECECIMEPWCAGIAPVSAELKKGRSTDHL